MSRRSRSTFALPFGVIGEVLDLAPPPDGPGPFALAGAGVLADLVHAAGFGDVRSGTTTVVYEAPSATACTEWIRDVAPPITELLAGQPEEVRERVSARVPEAWARRSKRRTSRFICGAPRSGRPVSGEPRVGNTAVLPFLRPHRSSYVHRHGARGPNGRSRGRRTMTGDDARDSRGVSGEQQREGE